MTLSGSPKARGPARPLRNLGLFVSRGCVLGPALLATACSMGSVGGPATSSSTGSMGGASGISGAAAGGTSGSTSGTAPASGSSANGNAQGPAPAVILPPTARAYRLSHAQLVNTYGDLLGLADVSAADSTLTLDATVNYDNQADTLFVADQFWQNLQQVAELYAHTVATSPTLLAALLPANAPSDPAGKESAFILQMGLRAYRRPLLTAEVAYYHTLFNQGPTLIGGADSFADGAELVLQAMLQSPHFVYRIELSDQVVGDRIPLNDYEVAAKLSYALTNTMPDATLFAAAAQSKVANAADLANQAQRLLATTRGTAAVEHFHFQTYRMGGYNAVTKDAKVFPAWTAQYTQAVGPAMTQENLLFLDWVFNTGKGVTDIYTAPVSFVNNLLAPSYGLKGTFTSAFQQVSLDPTQRAGLLTQLGFLSTEATTTDVATIRRGVFVNERVLCVQLPPPSPLATALPPITANETDRQLVNGFTGPGTCANGCHNTLINPLGFAFENYDSIGAYRTTDHGQTINAADSYTFVGPGLLTFNDAVGLEKDIAQSEQAHACYVQHWANYLYARPVADSSTGVLNDSDAPTIGYLAQESLAHGLSLKDIILSLATNDTFLARSPKVN